MFDGYGFSYAFEDINTINIEINSYAGEFKRRAYDNFTQDWYRTLNNNSMLHVN